MMQVTYFASGASAVNDIRGFARILHPLGVAVPALSERSIAELLLLAGLPLRVFVDNGAFSEMAVGPAGLEVVAPISEEAWCARVATMHRIAAALGAQAIIVAPDRVGDQAETLVRLGRHADALRAFRAIGARVLVPIQRGAMTATAFDAAVAGVLGFSDFIRGITGNKDAMPTAELEEYVKAVRPSAAHFLGVGPKNPRYEALVDVFRRMVPSAELSCDSGLLAANVGRSNGPGGTMRRLTAFQHPNEAGSCLQMRGADGAPSKDTMPRDSAIVLAFGPQFFFQRFVRGLAEQGIVLDGFERVGDGVEAVGFELPKKRALQFGLFDEVR